MKQKHTWRMSAGDFAVIALLIGLGTVAFGPSGTVAGLVLVIAALIWAALEDPKLREGTRNAGEDDDIDDDIDGAPYSNEGGDEGYEEVSHTNTR